MGTERWMEGEGEGGGHHMGTERWMEGEGEGGGHHMGTERWMEGRGRGGDTGRVPRPNTRYQTLVRACGEDEAAEGGWCHGRGGWRGGGRLGTREGTCSEAPRSLRETGNTGTQQGHNREGGGGGEIGVLQALPHPSRVPHPVVPRQQGVEDDVNHPRIAPLLENLQGHTGPHLGLRPIKADPGARRLHVCGASNGQSRRGGGGALQKWCLGERVDARRGMWKVWHEIAWGGMGWHGVALDCMGWHGIAWGGNVQAALQPPRTKLGTKPSMVLIRLVCIRLLYAISRLLSSRLAMRARK
jgi:hypothetical protein